MNSKTTSLRRQHSYIFQREDMDRVSSSIIISSLTPANIPVKSTLRVNNVIPKKRKLRDFSWSKSLVIETHKSNKMF